MLAAFKYLLCRELVGNCSTALQKPRSATSQLRRSLQLFSQLRPTPMVHNITVCYKLQAPLTMVHLVTASALVAVAVPATPTLVTIGPVSPRHHVCHFAFSACRASQYSLPSSASRHPIPVPPAAKPSVSHVDGSVGWSQASPVCPSPKSSTAGLVPPLWDPQLQDPQWSLVHRNLRFLCEGKPCLPRLP